MLPFEQKPPVAAGAHSPGQAIALGCVLFSKEQKVAWFCTSRSNSISLQHDTPQQEAKHRAGGGISEDDKLFAMGHS